jgi:probable HAF family extracellular repeat protein
MWFPTLLRGLISGSPRAGAGPSGRRPARRKPAAFRLHLEPLEDRCCPSYAITDLSTLGGATSQANAINSTGQVVGTAQIASGSHHPFLYSGGVMTDLGVAPGFTDGSARAVNAAGQVAVSEGVGGNINGDAFLWQSSSGLTDLGNLGSSPTIPLGINNATTEHAVQVVGTGTPGHAWIWQNGVMTDLNSLLPANSGWVLTEADGITDSQQIVGQGTVNGQYHAYLWQFGSAAAPTDLGTLPGAANSGAKAINIIGQVAGWSNTPPPNQDHAVLWTSGQINDLGSLPGDYWSTAYALNSSNHVQVVGSSHHYSDRAVLWQGGTVIDLNSQIPKKSGWSLLENAYAINDSGRIIGQGQLASGSLHAFLLTPTSTKTAAAAMSTSSQGAGDFAVAPSSPPGTSAPLPSKPIALSRGPDGQASAPSMAPVDPFRPSMLSKGSTIMPSFLAGKRHQPLFAAFADDLVAGLP